MSRLGGQNSNLYARIGGLTQASKLSRAARSLAMRVRGGASGDTGEALTAALDNALAKRRRDLAPAAVKAGAAGLERDVVQSMLRAIDAPPTSPSKSPTKKKPKGGCFDGARVLMTARRGQSLHLKVRAAYNASTHEYDFDGEEGAANSICALGKRIFDGELTVGKKELPGGVEGYPRWYVEKHQRRRKTLPTTGRQTVLSKPARAAIAHEICVQKQEGRPLRANAIEDVARTACVALGKLNRKTDEPYTDHTSVKRQVGNLVVAAGRDYGVPIALRRGQGQALERAKACDYGELQENVARVKIGLREFQEDKGKVSDEDLGNWDETFLDLCKFAQKGAYLAPDDGLSVQCITPLKKSPHITLLIFTLGPKVLKVLVGLVGVDGIAPHPYNLSLLKDKERFGMWQSKNGWITDETKYHAPKQPCCINFDGHGSNTAVRYDPDDPEKVLESVAELLAQSKVFGHCPKAHTTNIGTQQTDLSHGIIQKGCRNFDRMMERQVGASLDLRGPNRGRVAFPAIFRLLEIAFFEMGADEPKDLMRDNGRVGNYREDGFLCWDPLRTMDLRKLDMGATLGRGRPDDADSETNKKQRSVEAGILAMKNEVEAVGASVREVLRAPCRESALSVPCAGRRAWAPFGVIVTSRDFLLAQQLERENHSAEAKAAAAKFAKVDERWESRRVEIRILEARLAAGGLLEEMKVADLKMLIYGHTGHCPKAKNIKDGDLEAEARDVILKPLLLPPTPIANARPDGVDRAVDEDDDRSFEENGHMCLGYDDDELSVDAADDVLDGGYDARCGGGHTGNISCDLGDSLAATDEANGGAEPRASRPLDAVPGAAQLSEDIWSSAFPPLAAMPGVAPPEGDALPPSASDARAPPKGVAQAPPAGVKQPPAGVERQLGAAPPKGGSARPMCSLAQLGGDTCGSMSADEDTTELLEEDDAFERTRPPGTLVGGDVVWLDANGAARRGEITALPCGRAGRRVQVDGYVVKLLKGGESRLVNLPAEAYGTG
ncbi:hypothetical protein M885DRAFT_593711 [Pelagophyceae sp. CCMP2097]|nr:hypothetical protein M885DRAFT_593711 [Pelagophyceae sp. CCMP2097]